MTARQANAGFSLVEVVCAILILGVALAALTQGITTALASSKESEEQTNAALIASGQIETLRAEGDLTDGDTEGECPAGLERYRWKQSITRTDIDGLHEVAVVVERARSGQAIYELRTLLFEPPTAASVGGAGERRGAARSNPRGGRR
jgi:general secretion pathway protein I